MPLFPRLPGALSILATPPVFPAALSSVGQSNKLQMRSVGNMGRTWTETYPLLDLANPNVRALIQALNQAKREGTVWDVQHPYWHKRSGDGSGTPLVNGAGQAGATLVLDGATKQLINAPEDITGPLWADIGTPITTAGQADPFGGTNAVLINDNDNAIQEARQYTGISFSTTGTKAVSVFVKKGTAVNPTILILDVTTGLSIYGVFVTWQVDGTPTLANYFSSVGTFFAPQSYGGGWWRITFTLPIASATDNYRMYLYPAGTGGVFQGSTSFFGPQVFDQATPFTDYYWLRQGDLIQVAGSPVIFDVAGGCQPNNLGVVRVPISPPIFTGREPADNAPVQIDPTQIFFKAIITNVSDYPAMDVTRFIPAGLEITFQEQPQ